MTITLDKISITSKVTQKQEVIYSSTSNVIMSKKIIVCLILQIEKNYIFKPFFT